MRRLEKAIAAATRVSAGLLSGDEPERQLESVLGSALEVLGGEIAAIALFEESPSSLTVRTCIGGQDLAGSRMPVSGSLAGTVASTGRAEIVDDVANDRRPEPRLIERGVRRVIAAPLRAGGRVLGTIFVAQKNLQARPDAEGDLLILGMFSELAAGALHGERALKEERTFSSRLAALSARIASPQSAWETTPIADVLRDCAWILGGEAALLTELDGEGCYRIVESWRVDAELVERWRMPAKAADRLLGVDGMGRILAAPACGLRGWAQDLYVDVPRGSTTMRLHVLCGDSRSFGAADVRLANVVGVQLGGLLDRVALFREIRQSNDAQRHASQRLRELYDDIDEGIVVLDSQGRVSFASRRAYQVLHATPQALLERGVFRFAIDEDQPLLLRAFAQALDGARVSGELRLPEGPTMRTLAFTLRPEHESPDASAAVRMVLMDVTDARRREADTLHREKLASVGVLAAGIAHEINNPLAFVLGNYRFLSERVAQLADPEIDSMMQDSLEGLERVRKIVGDLRLFTRKDPDGAADLDLAPLIQSSVGMAAPAVRMRARLETVLEPGLPSVKGWGGLLGQALLNLIVNAAQAIPEGAPDSNHVSVRAWSDSHTVSISVKDSGPGIAPEVRTKLFTPFFTTKSPREGTGLGLAISYDAVRRHGGRIEVDSDPGHGATFTIVLPLARPQQLSA